MRRKIDHQIPQFLRNRRSLVIEVSVLLRSFEIYKDTQLMVVHQVSQKQPARLEVQTLNEDRLGSSGIFKNSTARR